MRGNDAAAAARAVRPHAKAAGLGRRPQRRDFPGEPSRLRREPLGCPTLSLGEPCAHARSGPGRTAAEPGTVWHPAQLAAFLATAQGHRLFAFYQLAAYTGARRGELLNLRWRDIDLDTPQIRITGSAAVIAGKRIEGTTKSGRSRTISLDADTAQVSGTTGSARPRTG